MFTRYPHDGETFYENDADFFSVTEKVNITSALGKFFLTIIGALAQLSLHLIHSRHGGSSSLGKSLPLNRKKSLISDRNEQAIVKRAKELNEEGKSSSDPPGSWGFLDFFV